MPPKEFLKTKIEFNVNNEMLCFIANITNLSNIHLNIVIVIIPAMFTSLCFVFISCQHSLL